MTPLGFLVLAALAIAQPPPTAAAPVAAPAPDLEIVTLQTTGPGRMGDCNSVVARVRNVGSAPTAAAPTVRLEVAGGAAWSGTASASTPVAPGETVEVWFEHVTLPAGLARVEAIADPDDQVRESDEANNRRFVPRDPRLACGAPEPPPPPGIELRVVVTAAGTTPLAGATVEVASPLRSDVVLASATTGADGHAALVVPPDSRSPVLRVSASAPGCPPVVRLATPPPAMPLRPAPPGAPPAATTAAAPPIEVAIELACSAGGDAHGGPSAAPGTLTIESALPGRLQIDDDAPVAATFGSRFIVERPGATVRVRSISLGGTSFFDQTVEVPRDAARELMVDAPVLRAGSGDAGVIEDLRSGLSWTVGAKATTSQTEAAAICERLERAGTGDWRLPDIDQLAFVLEARARPGFESLLPDLSDCCVWSSTAQAGLHFTFYVDGGHIYGRHGEEAGIGALCVRGDAFTPDPVLIPERYHDRLPGSRRFRPHD